MKVLSSLRSQSIEEQAHEISKGFDEKFDDLNLEIKSLKHKLEKTKKVDKVGDIEIKT